MTCPSCGTDNGANAYCCYRCGAVLEQSHAMVADGVPFGQDSFVIYRSTLRHMGLCYSIRDVADRGVLYAEAEWPLREATRFYTDESKTVPFMTLQKVYTKFWTTTMSYVLTMANGNRIGTLERRGFIDWLLRGRVHICDGRLSWIGYAEMDSSCGPWARLFLPSDQRAKHDYVFTDGRRIFGTLDRSLALTQQYRLDVSEDIQKVLDRRLAVALAVLLAEGNSF